MESQNISISPNLEGKTNRGSIYTLAFPPSMCFAKVSMNSPSSTVIFSRVLGGKIDCTAFHMAAKHSRSRHAQEKET